jgi:CheY-specific phosphatase CheX
MKCVEKKKPSQFLKHWDFLFDITHHIVLSGHFAGERKSAAIAAIPFSHEWKSMRFNAKYLC